MQHIFVSYNRADREWVRKLVARLERLRLPVWIDQTDIPVTVPWMTEVQDAIDEAALFLRCDSPAFRRSDHCNAEVGLATQAAKPQFVVTVGDDPGECANRIAQTFGEIPLARGRRTELRVLARDWDRAGRPRGQLVGRTQRRRLVTGLALPPAATETEQSFLRASRSRSRQLLLLSAAVLLVIAASGITTVVFQSGKTAVADANSLIASSFQQEQDSLQQIDRDPYRGLQLAAADDSGSNPDDEVITAALADPVPDDSFPVPAASRFASKPVGAQVTVVGAAGQEWRHAAAAPAATQPATRLSGPWAATVTARADPSAAGPGGLAAHGDPASGLVRLFKNGQLWRTIHFSAVTGSLAFSPDGRFLAATVGEQVQVADVASAQIRIALRGATGALLDVTWSADGSHVWALDDGGVFCWPMGDAVTLLDVTSADYNSALPAASPGLVWIVGAHALTEISVSTGRVLASKPVDDTLTSAGAAPDDSVALVSGDKYLWVIPLSGGAPSRPVRMPSGCVMGRPTFGSIPPPTCPASAVRCWCCRCPLPP